MRSSSLLRRLARPLAATALVVLSAAPVTPVVAQASGAPAPPAARPNGDPAHPKRVAILYFDNNTGKTDFDGLGRGIAAMLITDLSKVPEIQLVERDRMQAVLDEQHLQQTSLFDPATAVKAGKLLGAEYLLTGAFSTVDPNMRIDTRVVRVETGEVVRTAKVQGKGDKFFELQQKLAKELVDGLPVAVSPEAMDSLAAQQQRNRIDDQRTLVGLSRGMDQMSIKDYAGAVETLAPCSRGRTTRSSCSSPTTRRSAAP
jgi:curli biogenesis system outer membrane secretion channel CsgG